MNVKFQADEYVQLCLMESPGEWSLDRRYVCDVIRKWRVGGETAKPYEIIYQWRSHMKKLSITGNNLQLPKFPNSTL